MTIPRRFAAAARPIAVPAAVMAALAAMDGCAPDSPVPTLTAPAPPPAPTARAEVRPAPSSPETVALEAGTVARQVSLAALQTASTPHSDLTRAFAAPAPSSAAGGHDPEASGSQKGSTAGLQSATEEEEEEEEEEEKKEGGTVVGQDPPCDVAGGPSVSARALSPTQIEVSWTIPRVPGCDDEVSVTVVGGKLNKSTTGTSVTDIGLTPNTQYCYTVTADDRGSGRACARTPAKCDVTSAEITARPQQMRLPESSTTLTWSHMGNGSSRCNVVYDVDGPGVDLDGTTDTSTTVTGLTEGTHTFTVKAYDSRDDPTGASDPVEVIVREQIRPCDVTSATITATPATMTLPESSTTLTWSHGGNGSSRCNVVYDVDGPGVDLNGTTDTSTTVDNLTQGTHTFTVKAYDSRDDPTGASDKATVRVNPPEPLDTPGNVQATASGTTVTITWDSVSDATGYTVERVSPAPKATKTTNRTRSSWSGLSRGTQYCFRVKATGSRPDSRWSSQECDTPPDLPRPPPVVTPRPDAPGNFEATAGSWSSVDLSWDAVSGADSYELQRRLESGSYPAASQVTRVTGATTYADSGLSGNTEYCYRVRTVDGGQRSGWAAEDCATTPTRPPDAPDAPANLTATAASASEIGLRWNAVTGADSYEVLRRLGSGSYPADSAAVAVNTGTTYRDTGLTASTQYCHQVRTVDDGVRSPWSSEDCATTLAVPPPDAPRRA